MSETWYRVDMNDEITEVEVEYSTAHFVMIANPRGGKPKRDAIIGFAYNYFPTQDEAIQYILERASWSVAQAETHLDDAKARLARVEEKYHG